MRFFVVIDRTGYPAVVGEQKIHDHPDHVLDVVSEHPSFEAAQEAAHRYRESRRALAAA